MIRDDKDLDSPIIDTFIKVSGAEVYNGPSRMRLIFIAGNGAPGT